jgi:hypothetical protein
VGEASNAVIADPCVAHARTGGPSPKVPIAFSPPSKRQHIIDERGRQRCRQALAFKPCVLIAARPEQIDRISTAPTARRTNFGLATAEASLLMINSTAQQAGRHGEGGVH